MTITHTFEVPDYSTYTDEQLREAAVGLNDEMSKLDDLDVNLNGFFKMKMIIKEAKKRDK